MTREGEETGMPSAMEGIEPEVPPADDHTGVPASPHRGRLHIDDRAVRKVAEEAAAEVTGRTVTRQGFATLGAQSLPRATVKVIGRHVRISLDVSTPDGRSLPEWAARTREHVKERVAALTGLTVDVTDVRIARLGSPELEESQRLLPPAQRPARPGPARAAGVCLALLVTGLGAVALYDALVGLDVLDGGTAIDAALNRLDGMEPASWMLAAGPGIALVGLWLVLAACWRRPRRSLPVTSDTGVYASRPAVEGLAIDTVAQHPGVVKARAKVRAKAVILRLDTDGEATAEQEVRDRVGERLSRLSGPPEIRTSVRRTGISR
ncbi:DUF6286 domain-containing protein [Phytoactinopolyspora mesophila]|uniref:Asp23/Gls24 family envelope stress response protein n=1 Tax=Phytoactinopolyspora mesophila TaxID=2650750 RepID=A0A7K3MES4_9ACTN|nr:DUF6286 domain-containing protein [Phytoactinopolyspora mesophila]NDL60908.1 Asp23/Gls24 family envelope stress response protein [Phytoactinopolyspora mesophila]